MSYLDCLPPDLRGALRWHAYPGYDINNTRGLVVDQLITWEHICGSESPRLIMWYYEGVKKNGYHTFIIMADERKLDRLFEWNSHKLIKKLILTNDVHFLRDLATAALNQGLPGLVRQLVDLFHDLDYTYFYTRWGHKLLSNACKYDQWELVSYLSGRGFRIHGFIQNVNMSEVQFFKYLEIESGHYDATHHGTILFPDLA